jgi:hypothetical protein
MLISISNAPAQASSPSSPFPFFSEHNVKKLFLIAVAASAAACASIVHGRTQDIGISSSPSGARVTIDSVESGRTPFVAKLSRKNRHVVKLSVDGYSPTELTLTKGVSGWAWGNIIFGGLIGLAVDASTGALYNLNPAELEATLARQGARVTPIKDGVHVVLVMMPSPTWSKVGLLLPADDRFTGHH